MALDKNAGTYLKNNKSKKGLGPGSNVRVPA
jgi:hypothetical protein